MDKIYGVPAHPLLVHIPVVFVPLAALGALVMLVWPKSRPHINWFTAGAAAVGALGAIIAASAGEGLEELIDEHTPAIRHHAELGEGARTYSIIFGILIIAFVIWEHITRKKAAGAKPEARMRNLILAASVVTVLAGGFAAYSVYDAGHSGAKSTWGDAGQEESQSETNQTTDTNANTTGEGGENGEAGEGAESGNG